MIIFAVVIMVLCAVFALGILVGSGESVELAFFTFATNASVDMVFVVGIITGVVFMLGLWLLKGALRRERSRHVERKEMEHRRDELEREKAELEAKLGTQRSEPAPSSTSSSSTVTTSRPVQPVADSASDTDAGRTRPSST